MAVKIDSNALVKMFEGGQIKKSEISKLAKEYGLREVDIKSCKSAWDLEKMIKSTQKSE